MSFLHTGLLWLLPLAAIPLLLHLLTLHRLKTIELSTFRFLFDSYVQQRRRMQFLEALLAMLRTLFMLFLVMLVSRPIITQGFALFHTGGSGHEVVMLVDCSASMNAQTGGLSALDRAKSTAMAVVEKLSPDDKLTLIRVSSRPEEVFSQFSADTASIKSKIEGLKATPSRANLFAAFTHLFGPEATRRTNPVVYLFTDCQSSGWREARDQGLERLIPAETQFVVVNVGSKEAIANLAVLGDAPRRQRAVVGLPIELQARVGNFSKNKAEAVPLSVLINEKEVARAKLTLLPGEVATRKVIYEPSEPGLLCGRFELSGKSADRFPDDDSFLFTLNVVPRIRVLLVNGNPTAEAYDSESLYVRTALTSSPKSGDANKLASEPAKDLISSLDVRDIPEANLNPEALRDASVVILLNCGTLNPTQFGWLQNFVATGGGLLVFPGDRVKPEIYNTQFFALPGPQRKQPSKEHLTPITLGPPEGDPEKFETFERLASIDFGHPVLSVFDDSKVHYFKSVHFKRRFRLVLPDKRENAWPMAEYANGAPALVESKYGDGTLVVASFPLNVKWTNLPTRYGEFVPLVLRLVDHVQHRPELEGPSVVPADTMAEFNVAGAWGTAEGTVKDASGHASKLPFERAGSRLVSAFERTVERGYYTVEVRGGGPNQPKSGTLSFAVNLAPEESDFVLLNEKQFNELLPMAKVTFVDATAEEQQMQGTLGNDQEVWSYLIALLFVIIAVEFLLATLGAGKAESERQQTVAERIREINPGAWIGRMTGGGARKPTSE